MAKVLKVLDKIRQGFNAEQSGGKKVSLADLIVLGGCAAVEKAAKDAGVKVEVPFAPGRTDATQEQTDADSFAALELKADGFRNYLAKGFSRPAEHLLVDRAQLLTSDRSRDDGARRRPARARRQPRPVEARRLHRPARHSDATTSSSTCSTWARSGRSRGPRACYEGRDRATGKRKWTGTRVDLVFGSNSQLRALAEVYACDDAKEKFVHDFVAAWDKVMNLDRFDLR